MENVDKKNIGLPSRYINALYELCDESKNLKKITQDFEKFIKLVEDNKNLNNLEVSRKLLVVSKKIVKLDKKTKIFFVKDRPGHDVRYALDSKKIKKLHFQCSLYSVVVPVHLKGSWTCSELPFRQECAVRLRGQRLL